MRREGTMARGFRPLILHSQPLELEESRPGRMSTARVRFAMTTKTFEAVY